MTEQEVLEIFRRVGAILEGHFILRSGLHSDTYVNKDAVYPYVKIISILCKIIAQHFANSKVEAVIGPAMGGIILSQRVAEHLMDIAGQEVFSVFADKQSEGGFVIKRGYGQKVRGKKVLVVEDIITKGDSARKVIEATRAGGGIVVGLGVLCNRGELTTSDLADVPELFALVHNIKAKAWVSGVCPLCANKVPFNTDVGKAITPTA